MFPYWIALNRLAEALNETTGADFQRVELDEDPTLLPKRYKITCFLFYLSSKKHKCVLICIYIDRSKTLSLCSLRRHPVRVWKVIFRSKCWNLPIVTFDTMTLLAFHDLVLSYRHNVFANELKEMLINISKEQFIELQRMSPQSIPS